MQLVLLAAGKGSRLGLDITNKCFTRICGKSLLNYNLEMLVSSNINEIVVVVGYNAKHIINYIGTTYQGIPVTYVKQEQLLGIAHAIKTAMPYIHDDFIMCLSDELFIDYNIKDMLNYFFNNHLDCLCGVVKDTKKNIQKAYTIDVSENGDILCLVEKPETIFNQWKGTGCCIMKQSMLTILESLLPNPKRNEYEMGNWIQLAVDFGFRCKIYNIASANFNINTQNDIVLAEAYMQHRKGDL